MEQSSVSVQTEISTTQDQQIQTIRCIIKRDGLTVQVFDVDKIRKALSAAWKDAKGTVEEKALNKVVNTVNDSLVDETLNVENVQDAVEAALMRHGQFAVAKSFILYRHKRDEARKTRTSKPPDPKAISDYIHAGKYARYNADARRREVFEETVERVEAMHIKKYPSLEDDIKKSFDMVRAKKVLPSMRSMQFGGTAIEANNARIYNCSFTHVDRPEAFSEALFLLLSGCGVGYSVQFDHVEKLPSVSYIDVKNVRHHVIDDTIEGWADALKALVQSYIDGVNLEFAYCLIRPQGVPLKTSGGRAPGHLKLKESLERIRGVFNAAQGRKLRPVECHRIMCHAADAVLSGGIRRSAMISLFSLDDSEMMHIKTGNWFAVEPWLANANNSVVLKRDEVKKKQFKRIFGMTKQWGEPGFFFVNDYDFGTNPCVSGDTLVTTNDGTKSVRELAEFGGNFVVQSYDATVGKIVHATACAFKTKENALVMKIATSDGKSIVSTPDHEIYTQGGWVHASDVTLDDKILVMNKTSANDFVEWVDVVEVTSTTGREDVYDLSVDETHCFFANDILVHNCGEIGLNPKITVTQCLREKLALKNIDVAVGSVHTGWSFCNLCEINAAKLKSFDDFVAAARAATVIGTLQAGYTDLPYLGWVSEQITQRDALLGIGMTGMLDSPRIACNPEYQKQVAGMVKLWNSEYADKIGINHAARTTCVKPSGTTSLELGCVASGHHPHHAKRYIRRVTADELEYVFQEFKSVNPHMCVRKPDGKWVIEFPVEAPKGAIVKDDVSAIEFLNMVKSTQQNWVIPGTTERSEKGLNHNVSNTVVVKSNEWEKVAEYLWDNREFFTGVSFIPSSGDKDYAYAPNEAITTSADEARWNSILESYKPVDYTKLVEEDDDTDLRGEAACAGGSCSIV